jgi:hypothetical protein
VSNSASVIPGFDSTMHTIASPVHVVGGETASSRCWVAENPDLNELPQNTLVIVGGRDYQKMVLSAMPLRLRHTDHAFTVKDATAQLVGALRSAGSPNRPSISLANRGMLQSFLDSSW